MWVRPAVELAEAQAAAGGRAWLSRFDHAPGLTPYDALGPTHGADNACLWAPPPRFVERPLLARPGGPMTRGRRRGDRRAARLGAGGRGRRDARDPRTVRLAAVHAG